MSKAVTHFLPQGNALLHWSSHLSHDLSRDANADFIARLKFARLVAGVVKFPEVLLKLLGTVIILYTKLSSLHSSVYLCIAAVLCVLIRSFPLLRFIHSKEFENSSADLYPAPYKASTPFDSATWTTPWPV